MKVSQRRDCYRSSRKTLNNSRLDKAEKADAIRGHLPDERQTTSEDVMNGLR